VASAVLVVVKDIYIIILLAPSKNVIGHI